MNSGAVGDIATIIDYRGSTPPKSPAGIKLLTAKVIKDGRIDESRLEYISEETYAWWMRRGFPKQGDILLTTEAPLGEVALLRTVEPIALAQRVILLRGDSSIVNQQYLFAALRSPLMQDRLRQRATGTTVLGIKQSELRQVQIPLPTLAMQHKIAAILSAYDDLIENNHRRIKLLEETAQRVYREWFVEFRYPGHEGVPLVDSEIGPIPKDWTVGRLGDLMTYDKGRKPKTLLGSPQDGYLPQLLVDSMEGGPVAFAPMDDGVIAEATDVVMITDGSRSGVVYNGVSGIVGSTLARLRAARHTPFAPFHLILLLRDREHEIRSKNVGAAIPHANKEYITRIAVGVPTVDTAQRFEREALALFSLQHNLAASNRCLRSARDLLLPRLISGEIDVTDLDIVVPEAAA